MSDFDDDDFIGSGDGRKVGKKHNQEAEAAELVTRDQLVSFVERIERLEEEKKGIAEDIKEVYAEAKGNGFDVKVLRKVVAIRKQDAAERAEQEAILDLYLHALGMPTD